MPKLFGTGVVGSGWAYPAGTDHRRCRDNYFE
ncbi:hypothetical protein H4W31_000770 [Plantactinospora soyae]|uniref:Uncharacterized protein n=1 Tax=Plantactinospora soyae TaxID=1544732 RepID=A0A927QW53_9ACTN|nr:hypothetical protein [Plantactinospora soyae]